LIAHVLDVIPADAQEAPIKQIISVVSTSSSPAAEPSAKYRMCAPLRADLTLILMSVYSLANLFNALPETSPRRLTVAEALVALVQANDEIEELEALQLSRPQVEKWFSQWDVSIDAKSAFLKIVADAFTQSGNEATAYTFLLDRLRLIPATSPTAEAASLETIASALRIPNVFDFDELAKIPALQSAKAHPLFALLKIFMLHGIKEYLPWVEANSSVLEQHALANPVLERKIRLLTLSTLASQNVGRDLPYSEIATALQVDESKVEAAAIDGQLLPQLCISVLIIISHSQSSALGWLLESSLNLAGPCASHGQRRGRLNVPSGSNWRSGWPPGRPDWRVCWRLWRRLALVARHSQSLLRLE